MKQRTQSLLLVLALLFVLGLTIGWTMLQWDECREHGFSNLYCLQHISSARGENVTGSRG